ncbi:MAG TPA: hypothetical protein PLC25_03565, partial [Bacilli bacterium]|nr:hypothetical protein [Bacilli bacterium]
MAYIQQENPMPFVGGYITFEVDNNDWATFGQTVLVSTPNPGSIIIGYFTIYNIIFSPRLLLVCINDPL